MTIAASKFCRHNTTRSVTGDRPVCSTSSCGESRPRNATRSAPRRGISREENTRDSMGTTAYFVVRDAVTTAAHGRRPAARRGRSVGARLADSTQGAPSPPLSLHVPGPMRQTPALTGVFAAPWRGRTDERGAGRYRVALTPCIAAAHPRAVCGVHLRACFVKLYILLVRAARTTT